MFKPLSLLMAISLAAACGTPPTTDPEPTTRPTTSEDPSPHAQVDDPALPRTTEDPEKITIIQRTSAWSTYLGSKYRIQIGDITGNEVLTKILDREGKVVIGLQAMRVGDTCDVLGKDPWGSIGLARLYNRLIGDDYAVFFVGTPEKVAEKQIHSILDQISMSRATFVRGNTVVDGPTMADHLRKDKAATNAKIRTAHNFLDRICRNRSAFRTKSYVQRGEDRLTIARWLGATP